MVRSVIADTSIEKYLDNLSERDEFSYGIIIGQVKQIWHNPKNLFQSKQTIMFTGHTPWKRLCHSFGQDFRGHPK